MGSWVFFRNFAANENSKPKKLHVSRWLCAPRRHHLSSSGRASCMRPPPVPSYYWNSCRPWTVECESDTDYLDTGSKSGWASTSQKQNGSASLILFYWKRFSTFLFLFFFKRNNFLQLQPWRAGFFTLCICCWFWSRAGGNSCLRISVKPCVNVPMCCLLRRSASLRTKAQPGTWSPSTCSKCTRSTVKSRRARGTETPWEVLKQSRVSDVYSLYTNCIGEKLSSYI